MYLQKNKNRHIFTMVCLVSYLLLAPFMFTSCSMFQNKEQQRIEKQDKTIKDYAKGFGKGALKFGKGTLSVVLTIAMIAWLLFWIYMLIWGQVSMFFWFCIVPELIVLFLRIKAHI